MPKTTLDREALGGPLPGVLPTELDPLPSVVAAAPLSGDSPDEGLHLVLRKAGVSPHVGRESDVWIDSGELTRIRLTGRTVRTEVAHFLESRAA